jgi:hypothetical protein
MYSQFIETVKIKKACNRSRTGDLLLTRQVLYQLSYTGLLHVSTIVCPNSPSKGLISKLDKKIIPSQSFSIVLIYHNLYTKKCSHFNCSSNYDFIRISLPVKHISKAAGSPKLTLLVFALYFTTLLLTL